MTNVTKRLPSLPSLPSAKSFVRCDCGCGLLCQNRFRPGHDSKLKGYVTRVRAGVWDRTNPTDVTAQLDAVHEFFGPDSGEARHTAKELGVSWKPKAEREAEAAKAKKTA